jgi:hypothetical protein
VCYSPHGVIALNQFFEGATYQRGAIENKWQIIKWWEVRRFHFNAVVAVVGTLTCVLMITCGFVSEPIVGEAIGLPDGGIFIIFGILLYAIAANICYTGGWIVELFLVRRSPMQAQAFGPRAFRRGMKFSIGLTLFPALLSWAVFLGDLAFGHRVAANP